MQAYSEAQRVLFGVMVERNQQGSDLERARRLDEAIVLYEAHVNDKFVGTHPYERLRIIYTKRNNYNDAIRVCRAFIALPKVEKAKKAKFQDHVQKLLQKRDR